MGSYFLLLRGAKKIEPEIFTLCNSTEAIKQKWGRQMAFLSFPWKKHFLLLTMILICFSKANSESVLVGYRDHNFGTNVTSTPTGEKPQSKLWYNDDLWWGSLWNPSTNQYEIYRFELVTQSFTTTGVAIDDRTSTKADCLWDGQKLYVVSNVFDTSAEPASDSQSGRLYRYSYDSSGKTYSLDAGFPVLVNSSKSETLVIDKDTTGQLWVTWMEAGNVMVNRSTTNDLTWGTPFVLPSQTSSALGDDISSIISLTDNSGSNVGIMWSNQDDKTMYFALHPDGNSDTDWLPQEQALVDPNLGQVADDHINLKMNTDLNGSLYAVTKTGLSATNAPLLFLLKRDPSGSWERYLFGKKEYDHTRPIVVLDVNARMIYVFAMSDADGTDCIYMKSTSMDNINFPQGTGTVFLKSTSDVSINNPTSTKQNVSSNTGLLVLASDKDTDYYLHNFLSLNSAAPLISSFSPSSGIEGTQVTLTGENFSGATSVQFNGIEGFSFVINSDTEIVAVVPANATTGPIAVTTSAGTGISDTDFVIEQGNGETAGPVYVASIPGSSSSSLTVSTSSAVAAVEGDLYLASISFKSYTTVQSVTGMGLTWTQVDAQCGYREATGVEVWMAMGVPTGDQVVTATFDSAPANAVMTVSQYTDVNQTQPVGSIVSANTGGVEGGCDSPGGTDTDTYSFPITTLQDSSNVFAAVAIRGRDHIPSPDFTILYELHEGSGGDIAGLAIQEQYVEFDSTIDVEGALSSTEDWAVIALEINSAPKSPAMLSLKIFVEGAYMTGGTMSTILADSGLIPQDSPFASAPRNAEAPANAVDWISLSLRGLPSGSDLFAKSYFLRSDGYLGEPDGTTIDLSLSSIADGSYYIVLTSRNHLSVMSADPIPLAKDSSSSFDFTTGGDKFYGTHSAKELESNSWGMAAGDINQDKILDAVDFESWQSNAQTGQFGYQSPDLNLDAHLTTLDYLLWYNNSLNGYSSQVP